MKHIKTRLNSSVYKFCARTTVYITPSINRAVDRERVTLAIKLETDFCYFRQAENYAATNKLYKTESDVMKRLVY